MASSHQPEKNQEDSFAMKLQQLRWKIDDLPEQHRPYLYELADVIAEQHTRLQRNGASRDDRA